MKKILPLSLIILLLNFTSSMEIGISPAYTDFYASPNEVICKEVVLFSDRKMTFYGEDRWALTKSKDLSSYNKNSQEFDLILTYPKELDVNIKNNIK